MDTATFERLNALERDNRRLRALLNIYASRFSVTEPGNYLATDDGDLDGPYPDIMKAARNCAADGMSCTIITVGERLEAEAELEDFGVIPGRDYPATLTRPAA